MPDSCFLCGKSATVVCHSCNDGQNNFCSSCNVFFHKRSDRAEHQRESHSGLTRPQLAATATTGNEGRLPTTSPLNEGFPDAEEEENETELWQHSKWTDKNLREETEKIDQVKRTTDTISEPDDESIKQNVEMTTLSDSTERTDEGVEGRVVGKYNEGTNASSTDNLMDLTTEEAESFFEDEESDDNFQENTKSTGTNLQENAGRITNDEHNTKEADENERATEVNAEMSNECLTDNYMDLTAEEAESFFDYSLSQEDCETMLYGVASKYFGITKLHEFQLEAASKAISGQDVLIIQPTGKGKSLCYQLIALQQKKIVFVFVPTLSLMYDQVMQLQAKDIPAIAFSSGDYDMDILCTSTGAVIVYLTAECIFGPSKECKKRLLRMQELVKGNRVSLIALDEAHLLVEWEHFRPSFKLLKNAHSYFPQVPLMGLTATAPPLLLSELECIFQNPKIFKASVDRDNIIFTVKQSPFGGQVPKSVIDGKCPADSYWHPLVEELAPDIGNKPCIIYVDSKKTAIDLTTSFNQHTNIRTAAYTGEDTSKSDKKAVLSNWSDEEVTLVVATSAFGLGINKGNIHRVYHIGVPASLESWIQQAGRGGRSGNTCTATVLFSTNYQILEFYLRGKNEATGEISKKKFSEIWKFLLTKSCRRVAILQYFKEDIDERSTCQSLGGALCDNCQCEKTTCDGNSDFNIIFDAINDLPNHGIIKICMWIRGTKNKKIRPPTDSDKAYGKGRGKVFYYWEDRIHSAIGDGLLQLNFQTVHACGLYKPQIAATLDVTSKGREVIAGSRKWSLSCLSPQNNQQSCSKKHRKSGGSNLIPIIEELLSSSSNWYEITETSQYQYPGVFLDQVSDIDKPPRLGYVKDISKLPHFTERNHHLLYNECQLSKGHYNDNVREVNIDGKERRVRIRYAACTGSKKCTVTDCQFAGSKVAKKCPNHPLAELTSTSNCPVYVVYVYPENLDGEDERWITGITKDDHVNYRCSNLHNHSVPKPCKVPTIVQNAVKQAVHCNPGLTPSMINLGIGTGFMPMAVSTAAHPDRVRTVYRKALKEITTQAGPGMSLLDDLDRILDQLESQDEALNDGGKISIHFGDEVIEDSVLTIYKKSGFGRPYRRSIGVQDSNRWFLCMNPLQSSLLSETEFLEMDVTYENCHEYPYLLNFTRFSYSTMRWTAVARVRMTAVTSDMYAAAIRGTLDCCNQDNNGDVVKRLKGVIVDWSSAQIQGLKIAVGNDRAEELLRGCQVHFMRAVHRTADKVCSGSEEKKIFTTLGSMIMVEQEEQVVKEIFSAMAGEISLENLPIRLKRQLPSTTVDRQRWELAHSWSQWWMRPVHLKMLTPAFTQIRSDKWQSMPSDTNGVESINKCSIDHSHRSKTLQSCIEFTYRQDKKASLEHLYAYSGLPISFQRKTVASMKERAVRQNKARYSKGKVMDDDDIGMKGTQCTTMRSKHKRNVPSMDKENQGSTSAKKAKVDSVTGVPRFGQHVRVLFEDGIEYLGVLVGKDSTTAEWITRFEDGTEDRCIDPLNDEDYTLL